ncbi:MAG: prolyl-tRNA synthetase associated domain-containing protein [Brucellaceae bacterium]|nr:prolyl-tRNA synthetase associated domain-containing protein [Brucellaceae bacterium]
MPVLSPEALFSYLDGLGIAHETVTHPPLHTVAESQELRGQITGAHTKNLFLKDKKDQFFLLTVEEDAMVDLKSIHHLIGAASRVSFGKPEKMEELLGVQPGAVTAFGLVNDTGGQVRFFIDSDLLGQERVNCHPLVNTATTGISAGDLIRFVEATGHTAAPLNLAG